MEIYSNLDPLEITHSPIYFLSLECFISDYKQEKEGIDEQINAIFKGWA